MYGGTYTFRIKLVKKPESILTKKACLSFQKSKQFSTAKILFNLFYFLAKKSMKQDKCAREAKSYINACFQRIYLKCFLSCAAGG